MCHGKLSVMANNQIITLCVFVLIGLAFGSGIDGNVDFGAASRHLLAADGADDNSIGTLYYNGVCAMVYSRSVDVAFSIKGTKTNVPLPGTNTSYTVSGNCTAKNSTLDVEYKTFTNTINKFSMNMKFEMNNTGAWGMSQMLVSIGCAAGTEQNCTAVTDLSMDVSFIKSYKGFSYHCYKAPSIKSSTLNATVEIVFNKLQVQGFDVKPTSKKFAAADDCVGFFTGGVWSSLFIALILTIILLYGVGMISSINSMDRFDDPRGPGIQINVAD